MGSIGDKIWLPIKLKQKGEIPLWSGRAEALNTQPGYEVTQKKTAGLFHIAGLVNEEGLRSTIDVGLAFLIRLIREAEEPLHYRPSWAILETFYVFFHEMKSLMMFISSHYPDECFIKEAYNGLEKLEELQERVKYNFQIFQGLVIDGIPENINEKFITTHLRRQYEKLGFQMEDCDVDKIIELDKTLEELSNSYRKCSPSEQLIVSTSSVKMKVLTTDDMLVSNDHRRRQEAYINYYEYDPAQLKIVEELLSKRHEYALILGYHSFSEKALSETPFGAIKDVQFFLRHLSECINNEVIEDFAIMTSIKQNIDTHPFIISDIKFITNWTRDHINWEFRNKVSEYLSLGTCIEGMNKVFQSIFFLQFDVSSMFCDEVYSPDMYKLQVIHTTWGLVSYIFLDLLKRPGKTPGTSHYVVREGKFEEDNEYISRKKWRPIRIVLIMSIEQSGYPLQLQVYEAEALFVEIGKLVPTFLYHFPQQYILRALSLINYEDIFSLLMRRLFYHPKVMEIIFKLYPSGDPIPKTQMENIISSSRIFQCADYQMLILKSLVDSHIHSEYPLKQRLVEVFKKHDKTYFPLPMIEGCYIHLKDPYMVDEKRCGKTFMELIDKAVAISLWKRYFEADPLDPEKSDAFFMCLYEALPICDVKECYSKLLQMNNVNLMKVAKILTEDIKENHRGTLEALEQIIDMTKFETDKERYETEYLFGGLN